MQFVGSSLISANNSTLRQITIQTYNTTFQYLKAGGNRRSRRKPARESMDWETICTYSPKRELNPGRIGARRENNHYTTLFPIMVKGCSLVSKNLIFDMGPKYILIFMMGHGRCQDNKMVTFLGKISHPLSKVCQLHLDSNNLSPQLMNIIFDIRL